MGVNPVPVAVFCTIVYSVQALMLATGAVVDCEQAQPGQQCIEYPNFDPDFTPDCGAICSIPIIGSIVGATIGLVDLAIQAVTSAGFIIQFISFRVLGAPWWIGTPIGVGCVGTIIWSIINVFRGN